MNIREANSLMFRLRLILSFPSHLSKRLEGLDDHCHNYQGQVCEEAKVKEELDPFEDLSGDGLFDNDVKRAVLRTTPNIWSSRDSYIAATRGSSNCLSNSLQLGIGEIASLSFNLWFRSSPTFRLGDRA